MSFDNWAEGLPVESDFSHRGKEYRRYHGSGTPIWFIVIKEEEESIYSMCIESESKMLERAWQELRDD